MWEGSRDLQRKRRGFGTSHIAARHRNWIANRLGPDNHPHKLKAGGGQAVQRAIPHNSTTPPAHPAGLKWQEKVPQGSDEKHINISTIQERTAAPEEIHLCGITQHPPGARICA